jgi:membrane protease YdiL (CAAX protease family)
MQEGRMDTSVSEVRGASLPVRIVAGWTLIFIALGLATWFGDVAEANWGIAGKMRYGIQALIMAGMVVPGILILRLKLDRKSIASLGLPGVKRSLFWFAFGVGIIIVPFVAIIVSTLIFGWATMTFNTSGPVIGAFSATVVTAFFFEALPEELAFRGYIYRNLNTRFARWAAALLTIALFGLLPSVLTLVQQYVLGMEVRIGGAGSLTIGYLITMAVFGAFTVYLRILTGTVWTSIGFHLAFLQMSRIFGLKSTALIQLTDITSDTPMKIIMIVSLLLIFGGLIAYPFITKRPLGWKEPEPEEA